MNEIRNALYYGKLYPAEQFYPQTPEYPRLTKAVAEALRSLRHDLGGEYAARLDDLDRLYLELGSMQQFESFAYGFQLGSQLTHEVCAMNF